MKCSSEASAVQDLFARIGSPDKSSAKADELRAVIVAAETAGARCIATGDLTTLRALMLSATKAAVVRGAVEIEEASPDHLPTALGLLVRQWQSLLEALQPNEHADRILLGERSPVARETLRLIASHDLVEAATLRRELEARTRTAQPPSNFKRIVNRLTEAGLVTADRGLDGTPCFGITLRGRAFAERLFPELAPVSAWPVRVTERAPGVLASPRRRIVYEPDLSGRGPLTMQQGRQTRLYQPLYVRTEEIADVDVGD